MQQQQQLPYLAAGLPHGALHNVASPDDSALMQQLVRLQQENAGLRGYAERVTKQLRSARLSQAVAAAAAGAAKAGSPVPAAAELQQQAERLPLPPWCLNMQLVSPLLAAYDERISELEEEAKEREKVIQGFSERVSGVTRENEHLAEELRSKTARLQQLFEAQAGGTPQGSTLGVSGGDKTYNCLLQERNELEELYSLTAEQSEVLLSQNHLLKCHVQHSEAALEEMRVVMVETERRAAAVAAREQTAAKQEETTERQAAELQEALEKQKELSKKLAAAEQETERLSAGLREAVQQQELQHQELQQQRSAAADAAALQHEIQKLRMQVETAAKETAAAKEVADYLEQRLATQAQEAEEMKRQADSSSQQLHEAIVEREKAAATAVLLQHHLDQLRGQHETELHLLRAAQGNTLEKRAMQAEELAEKLRKQLETLQRSHGEATVKIEAAERRAAAAAADAAQAREEVSASSKHHQTLQQHLQQAQAAAEAELARMKEALCLQSKEAAAKSAALASTKKQLEDSLAAVETARLTLHQQHQLLQHKYEQLQETASTQQQQLAEAAARTAAAKAEADAAKRKAEREVADARRRCENLTALAEAKTTRIQEAAERRQTAVEQQLLEEQQQRQRLGREYETQKRLMQQQLAKAVAANAALKTKVNELLSGLDQTLPPESVLDDDGESDLSP